MKRLVILCLASFGFFSCTHDAVIPEEPEISFSQQVLPIIISNCATEGCHDGMSGGEEDQDPLRNYAEVMEITKPGNARDSRLYKNITKLSGEDAMPPGRPLSEEQIRLIYVWIMQGAKNN